MNFSSLDKISEYNVPMWTYNSVRNQCYLHQYSSSQPDFMYRDNFENITREMLDIFTFWLNEGADGFRLHATEKLVESGAFTREAPIDPFGDLTSYENYENIYSRNYVSFHPLTNTINLNKNAVSLLTYTFFIHTIKTG